MAAMMNKMGGSSSVSIVALILVTVFVANLSFTSSFGIVGAQSEEEASGSVASTSATPTANSTIHSNSTATTTHKPKWFPKCYKKLEKALYVERCEKKAKKLFGNNSLSDVPPTSTPDRENWCVAHFNAYECINDLGCKKCAQKSLKSMRRWVKDAVDELTSQHKCHQPKEFEICEDKLLTTKLPRKHSSTSKSKGVKGWVIVLIIVGVILLVGAGLWCCMSNDSESNTSGHGRKATRKSAKAKKKDENSKSHKTDGGDKSAKSAKSGAPKSSFKSAISGAKSNAGTKKSSAAAAAGSPAGGGKSKASGVGSSSAASRAKSRAKSSVGGGKSKVSSKAGGTSSTSNKV